VIAFHLGGEMHACDIHLVEEVVTKRRVHRLPDMPPRLLGMLRLRGELVPVLDIAPQLDLQLVSESPAIMVVAMGDARLGIAADAVSEVVALTPESYRPAPLSGGERDAFVVGVARLGATLVNLIDLSEMLREQSTLAPGESR
jgi:purine-binding chemotaxis protein CheW